MVLLSLFLIQLLPVTEMVGKKTAMVHPRMNASITFYLETSDDVSIFLVELGAVAQAWTPPFGSSEVCWTQPTRDANPNGVSKWSHLPTTHVRPFVLVKLDRRTMGLVGLPVCPNSPSQTAMGPSSTLWLWERMEFVAARCKGTPGKTSEPIDRQSHPQKAFPIDGWIPTPGEQGVCSRRDCVVLVRPENTGEHR